MILKYFNLTSVRLFVFAILMTAWSGFVKASDVYIIPEDLDQDNFRSLASQLRCPTCVGLSVLNSDEKFANQIKDALADQLRQGKSEKEIYSFFEDKYGPWILRSPPVRGFHALAWIVPIAIMILGPLLIWFFVWRKQKAFSGGFVEDDSFYLEKMKEDLNSLRAQS